MYDVIIIKFNLILLYVTSPGIYPGVYILLNKGHTEELTKNNEKKEEKYDVTNLYLFYITIIIQKKCTKFACFVFGACFYLKCVKFL